MSDKCKKCEASIAQPKESFKCKECAGIFHQQCCGDTIKKVGTRNNWRCDACAVETSSVGSRASDSQSAVLDAIAAFRKESNDKLDQTVANLKKVQLDLDSVVRDVSGLKTMFGDLKCTSDKTVANVESLQVENVRLQREVMLLRGSVAELEQHTRKNNIIITGVPVTASEDVGAILDPLAKLLGIKFDSADVSAAHRLRGSPNDSRPPGIVVNFVSRASKMAWVVARRHIRSLSARELHQSFPDTQIYINEHLTKDTRDIFNAARRLVKTGRLASVWTGDCRVLAKKTQSGYPFRIASLRQVRDIEGLSSAPAGSELEKATKE